LLPYLACAEDAEILLVHTPDLRHRGAIALRSRGQALGIGLTRLVLAIGRWGDRQPRANRLDPVLGTVGVDDADRRFCRRSSSAWAKKATPCAGFRWRG
jgi:hypothetical protein